MANTHSDSGRKKESAYSGKEIAESVERAQKAMNRFDHRRKQVAAHYDHAPEEDRELNDLWLTLDSAVMDAYQKLRKYLVQDLEDKYWNKKIIGYDDNVPVVLGGRDGEEVDLDKLEDEALDGDFDEIIKSNGHIDDSVSVAFLEDYQGEVVEWESEERVRFEGYKTVTHRQPALLPPEAYRGAIRVLDEARRQLGFTPDADKQTPRTEISEDLLKEVREWRKDNLEELVKAQGPDFIDKIEQEVE